MGDDFLSGKRVLFICQKFYDYHEKILVRLKKAGAEVVFFENKMFKEDPVLHPNDLLSTTLKLFNPNYKKNYQNSILSETINVKFDILFCLGGGAITNDFVDQIRQQNEGIKTMIYFWDSFKIWPFQFLISAFDEVYSFDRQDCETYKIKYLPLFYSEDDIDLPSHNKRDIDILYVGSVNPVSANRLKVLANIHNQCKQQNISCVLYLFSRQLNNNIIKRSINAIRCLADRNYRIFFSTLKEYNIKYKFVYNIPLNNGQLKSYLYRAKCVIDITVPGQIGITMRSIETLHMGCKLITTNLSIKQESFFNEKWIKVVNEDNLNLDIEFLKSVPGEKICIDYLSLNNWLRTIIEN